MAKTVASKPEVTSGEELGHKLLQSVREMKAGKAARRSQQTPTPSNSGPTPSSR